MFFFLVQKCDLVTADFLCCDLVTENLNIDVVVVHVFIQLLLFPLALLLHVTRARDLEKYFQLIWDIAQKKKPWQPAEHRRWGVSHWPLCIRFRSLIGQLFGESSARIGGRPHIDEAPLLGLLPGVAACQPGRRFADALYCRSRWWHETRQPTKVDLQNDAYVL